MEKLLTLQVPGFDEIDAPEGVPTGGLEEGANILSWGITLAITLAVVVALIVLLYSGVQWILSQGDKQKIEAARHRIIFTVVGLVIIFLSFAIINVIGFVFGVNLLSLSGK